MAREPRPQLSEDLTREMRCMTTNDDAVVVGGVLLDFVQRRSGAATALDHVRVLRCRAVVRRSQCLPDDRRFMHRAAGEIGDSFAIAHPSRVAALMARVGA